MRHILGLVWRFLAWVARKLSRNLLVRMIVRRVVRRLLPLFVSLVVGALVRAGARALLRVLAPKRGGGMDQSVLPREYPRRFVPERADTADWPAIERLFDALERRDLSDRIAFRRWIADWDELSAAVGEEGSLRHIEMTLATDDPRKEKAHLYFVEEIQPRLRPRQDALRRRLLEAKARGLTDEGQHGVLVRDVAAEVELFREENVPLLTEEEKLGTEYQKIAGAMTVVFEGKERTLTQLAPVLEETDRKRREEVWRLTAARRLEDKERLEEVFDKLLGLRSRIAGNAGLADYRAYAFKERMRFDYTPEHCYAFHAAVEKHVIPLVKKLEAGRRAKMKLGVLRPWDGAVDPEGRSPLKPFKNGSRLAEGCVRIFKRLDPNLGSQFERMLHLGLLNLDNYKGKAPGGYQATLAERRLPFIFMNAVGMDNDVRTLLHEGGHAFHTFAARNLEIGAYRGAPLEFCEVASMAMELFALPYLGEFYPREEDLARARRERLESVAGLLAWIAVIDAYQHWIYTHPGHDRDQRKNAWLSVRKRFETDVDWTGLEEEAAYQWHRQLHLFLAPFYYIEYGIAQVGALGLWVRARRNPDEALAAYRGALSLGGSRPLPELFAAAALPFDFREETVAPLMAEVERAL